jgi:hypothetical protein
VGGESKIISSLVGRIVAKVSLRTSRLKHSDLTSQGRKLTVQLPCNSGTKLRLLELDGGLSTCAKSLKQLSRLKIDLVVQYLAQALDTLSKVRTPLQACYAYQLTISSTRARQTSTKLLSTSRILNSTSCIS